jgi:osmotically-inducible protein OsmY
MSEHDHLLTQRAESALRLSPHIARKKVRFESVQGRIKLTGVVNSYFEKQIAQELIGEIDGVGAIDNQLEVCQA